jgi:hypothetical protein
MREAIGSLTALAALLIVGCFGEAPMGGTGQTTGEPCQTGAPGCACYPNGTCDVNLECEPSLSLCVPQGCTPGERDCVCVDGACADPWVCKGGICGEDESETSSSNTSSMSSTSTSGGTSSASSDETTGTDGGSTDEGPSDTGSHPCASMMCGPCIMCVQQPGNPCAGEFAACEAEFGCLVSAKCQQDCANLLGCSDCCAGLSQNAKERADALTACVFAACGMCNPGPYDECG